MTHTIEDVNRRDLILTSSKIKDILPEYFVREYPNIIMFLEHYYNWLDGDHIHAFDQEIRNVILSRDISQTSLKNLDFLIQETGNGLQTSAFFDDPRLMSKLLPDLYSSKGSLVSTEGFFKAFFGENITVEYPKQQIFKVGEDRIGYESQKFIQDAGVFQVFSILIKVGLSVADYLPLYTKFVHPAGWHFKGEVQTEGQLVIGIRAFGEIDSEDPFGLTFGDRVDIFTKADFPSITGIIAEDNINVIVNITEDYIPKYGDLSIQELGRFYSTIREFTSPNSFTFDDSAEIFAMGLQPLSGRPDMSMDLETMDNDLFTNRHSSGNVESDNRILTFDPITGQII